LLYVEGMKTRSALLATIVLFAGLACLSLDTSMADPAPVPMDSAKKKPALKKRKPVTCTTTKDIVLDKVIIEADGPAATIMGSCDIIIKNSVIRTTGNALVVMGSGDITVTNSTIESGAGALVVLGSGDFDVRGSQITGDVAVQIDGSGDVAAQGSRFRGNKVIRGTGEYEDKGGNTWEKK
jgi:hypothetical protein